MSNYIKMETWGIALGSIGSTGAVGLILYLLKKWRDSSCVMKVGDKAISFDMKDIEEVIEKVDSPVEREKIKEEIRDEMKKTLHKVKSRLVNKLEERKNA